MSVELKLKTPTPAEMAKVMRGALEIYGEYDANTPQTGLTTNSKEAGEGIIFCAIRGSRVDGSDFIAEAVQAGSRCFICQRLPDNAKNCGLPFCAILVEDVIAAIGMLAGWYRGFSKAKFIGITGSVGKTTTKAVSYTHLRAHETD